MDPTGDPDLFDTYKNYFKKLLAAIESYKKDKDINKCKTVFTETQEDHNTSHSIERNIEKNLNIDDITEYNIDEELSKTDEIAKKILENIKDRNFNDIIEDDENEFTIELQQTQYDVMKQLIELLDEPQHKTDTTSQNDDDSYRKEINAIIDATNNFILKKIEMHITRYLDYLTKCKKLESNILDIILLCEIMDNMKELQKTRENIKELDGRVSKLESDILQKTNELEQAKKQHETTNIGSTEAKAELEQKIAKQNSELEEHVKSKQELEQQLNTNKKELDKLNIKHNKLIASNKTLTDRVEKLSTVSNTDFNYNPTVEQVEGVLQTPKVEQEHNDIQTNDESEGDYGVFKDKTDESIDGVNVEDDLEQLRKYQDLNVKTGNKKIKSATVDSTLEQLKTLEKSKESQIKQSVLENIDVNKKKIGLKAQSNPLQSFQKTASTNLRVGVNETVSHKKYIKTYKKKYIKYLMKITNLLD
jgi:hypothetical protein